MNATLNPELAPEIGYAVSPMIEERSPMLAQYLVQKTHVTVAEDIRYVLTFDRTSGNVTCTCPGFTYRGKCKHCTYLRS